MFHADEKALENNSVYRNAVALCVLQIGELANKLSEEYRAETEDRIPWRAVRGLRNIVAHEYGHIDYESLWETITVDIPMLKAFCESQVEAWGSSEYLVKDVIESEDEM